MGVVPISRGRHAGGLFEHGGKISWIAKAGGVAHLEDQHMGVKEQPLGVFYAHVQQVGGNAQPHSRLKCLVSQLVDISICFAMSEREISSP